MTSFTMEKWFTQFGLAWKTSLYPYSSSHYKDWSGVATPRHSPRDFCSSSHLMLADRGYRSHDPREVEPVERAAVRIIEAAKVSLYTETANEFEWQVSVIKDDKNQNAF